MVAVSVQNALISQPHNVLGAKIAGDAYVSYTSALALLQVAVAVGSGALLAVTGLAISAVWGSPLGPVIVVLGVASVPWVMQEFVRRTFYTRSESRAAFVNDVVCYGLQVVGVAVLLYRGPVTTEAALLVMGGSSLLATALGAWQLRASISRAASTYVPAALASAWRRNWSFGRWLTARAAVDWFGAHGHTWLLAAMLGPAALGMYRAAYHIVNVLNPITMAVQAYVPSRAGSVLAEGGTVALGRWVKRNFAIAGTLYTAVVLVVIMFSGQLLTLFYGDRFADMTRYLEWVIVLSALEKLVRKFKQFPNTVLLVMERTRRLFLLDVVSISLLLVAAVALINAYGILGAPLAKLIVAVAILATLAVQARSLLATSPPAAPTAAQGPRP
jgi:O-antigen/teichoic acid export membrane protein